jgi:hypothetical protein
MIIEGEKGEDLNPKENDVPLLSPKNVGNNSVEIIKDVCQGIYIYLFS